MLGSDSAGMRGAELFTRWFISLRAYEFFAFSRRASRLLL